MVDFSTPGMKSMASLASIGSAMQHSGVYALNANNEGQLVIDTSMQNMKNFDRTGFRDRLYTAMVDEFSDHVPHDQAAELARTALKSAGVSIPTLKNGTIQKAKFGPKTVNKKQLDQVLENAKQALEKLQKASAPKPSLHWGHDMERHMRNDQQKLEDYAQHVLGADALSPPDPELLQEYQSLQQMTSQSDSNPLLPDQQGPQNGRNLLQGNDALALEIGDKSLPNAHHRNYSQSDSEIYANPNDDPNGPPPQLTPFGNEPLSQHNNGGGTKGNVVDDPDDLNPGGTAKSYGSDSASMLSSDGAHGDNEGIVTTGGNNDEDSVSWSEGPNPNQNETPQ